MPCRRFEEGAIATAAARHGVTILTESDLGTSAGAFDVVTAIEVLEHTADPIATLGQIRQLLKPGGSVLLHHRKCRALSAPPRRTGAM